MYYIVVILFTSRSYCPLDIAPATGSADLKMQAKICNCSHRGVGKNGWLYRPFAKTGGVGGKRRLGTNADEWLYGCIDFWQNRGGGLQQRRRPDVPGPITPEAAA